MRWQPLAVIVAGLSAWTCAVPPKQQPASAPATDTVRGVSTAHFVADPANPAQGLPKNVELRAPMPLATLPLPKYPPIALAAGVPPVTVGLRFVVGVDGNVTGVEQSPLVPSTEGPFSGEFRAAAEEAVRAWRFNGAYLITEEDGPDSDGDGKPDYKRATSLDVIPVYLDVRIEFAIVNGKGTASVSGVPTGR
jgi:hypothetical protein